MLELPKAMESCPKLVRLKSVKLSTTRLGGFAQKYFPVTVSRVGRINTKQSRKERDKGRRLNWEKSVRVHNS